MYISGELLQACCKWNLDDRYELRIWTNDTLNEGDIIFLKISDIPFFLSNPPCKKVRLVIHNSDETFEESHYDMLEPYTLSVQAVNCNSLRAGQLPLGFRDNQYTPHSVLDEVKNEGYVEKDILCLVNFLIETNPKERSECFDYFNGQNFCSFQGGYFTYDKQKSLTHTDTETQQRRRDFYRLLKRSKFVVCPQGTGVDTHRFYEALFFGAIPIVKTSFLDKLYMKYKNVVVVKEWSDVTHEFLIHDCHVTEKINFSKNLTFITYGDITFENSRNRLVKEAQDTGIFKRCIGYTPDDLDEEFKASCKSLLSHRKGGGYWCWKPHIVLKTMQSIPENEWILYADAGCTLIQDRKDQIFEQIAFMDSHNKLVSAYQMNHLEKTWTKGDLFDYFGIIENKDIKDTGQYVGGVFLVKNHEKTQRLFEMMVKIMSEQPSLIDDSPSSISNDVSFNEHRHDQSLFSIIMKLNPDMTYVIPKDETYHGNAFVQALRLKE